MLVDVTLILDELVVHHLLQIGTLAAEMRQFVHDVLHQMKAIDLVCTRMTNAVVIVPWILERSATRLREADLNVLSKLGKQGLEWRLKPEAFAGREVGRQDDLLDVLVGCAVDIEVARQPST